VIRDGSSGNSQVDLIERRIADALSAGTYRAILLDLSDVRYTFGDHALFLIMTPPERGVRLALVVSELCQQLGDVAERSRAWHVTRSCEHAFELLSRPRGSEA
jgi:hypothetical protein